MPVKARRIAFFPILKYARPEVGMEASYQRTIQFGRGEECK